jgi:glycosidase
MQNGGIHSADDGPQVPMIYYGDEVAMWGGTDPDDRQPMVWKDLAPYEDPELL